jgi:hypothetical protein
MRVIKRSSMQLLIGSVANTLTTVRSFATTPVPQSIAVYTTCTVARQTGCLQSLTR